MVGGVMGQQLRLGFVISHLGPGGAQRVVRIVANAFAEDGHDVHVMTLFDEPVDVNELSTHVRRHRLGCRVRQTEEDHEGDGAHMLWRLMRSARRLLINIRFFTGNVLTLRQTFRAVSPDIVLSFVTLTNLMTILATRGLSVRTVVSERNDLQLDRHDRNVERLRRCLYPMADIVTANTHGALRDLKQFVAESKLAYVPNPIAVEASNAIVEYQGPTFICIGRLAYQKGFDTLLKAAKRAFDVLPTWRVAILGAGPLQRELASLADTLGISGRVDWIGHVSDPFPYLKAAEFFVSTSRFEGSPNALVEAMSCGLPAIVTDASPGPLELIGDEEAGVVVPVNDVNATTVAIQRLATDRSLRESLGRMAEVRARPHRPDIAIKTWRLLLLPT